MRKGGGPALEELAREGDANSIKFSVSLVLITHISKIVFISKCQECYHMLFLKDFPSYFVFLFRFL